MTSQCGSGHISPKQLTSWILYLAICIALLVAGAQAQQATALITGTVKDPSGAVVAGAKVTLRNSNTNIARSVTTNKDGYYSFSLVPIGTYDLTVEQRGFEKYVHSGITLEINQNGGWTCR